MMTKTIAVLGAGMVGVSCALELQRRGWNVTLIDRSAPGRESSWGNAGVFSPSSLIPMNNPSFWAKLPRLARNKSVELRYAPGFLLRHAGWLARFLQNARRARFEQTALALHALIGLSGPIHRQWLQQAGEQHRLHDNGWLFLYRSPQAFEASRFSRETLERFGVSTQVLEPHALHALEPHLKPIFAKALWIKDAAAVDNPGAVVDAYVRLFVASGGTLVQTKITGLARVDGDWQMTALGEGEQGLRARHVVVALGPWGKDFLRQCLGLSVPMVCERGYHQHFSAHGATALGRPIFDTGGGYVLAPMEMGLRLSTGVELTDLDAPPNLVQLRQAEAAARQALALDGPLEENAWLGSRPTLPDSRPVIGPCRLHPGLWLALGHQHIGLSTGPGTAQILADWLELAPGEKADCMASAFAPERWGL